MFLGVAAALTDIVAQAEIIIIPYICNGAHPSILSDFRVVAHVTIKVILGYFQTAEVGGDCDFIRSFPLGSVCHVNI